MLCGLHGVSFARVTPVDTDAASRRGSRGNCNDRAIPGFQREFAFARIGRVTRFGELVGSDHRLAGSRPACAAPLTRRAGRGGGRGRGRERSPLERDPFSPVRRGEGWDEGVRPSTPPRRSGETARVRGRRTPSRVGPSPATLRVSASPRCAGRGEFPGTLASSRFWPTLRLLSPAAAAGVSPRPRQRERSPTSGSAGEGQGAGAGPAVAHRTCTVDRTSRLMKTRQSSATRNPSVALHLAQAAHMFISSVGRRPAWSLVVSSEEEFRDRRRA